jgi:hypothetical protein
LSLNQRRALVAGLVVVALPVASALAAAPTKDGNYNQTKGNKSVASLHVSKDGKKVDSFSSYGKCNAVPFNPPVAMKITPAGTFSLTGNRKDVIGKTHKVVIHGKFTNAKTVVGDAKIDGSGCSGKKVKFTATLTGTGGDSSGI